MSPEELYLDLLKKCLTRTAFPERYRPLLLSRTRPLRRAMGGAVRGWLRRQQLDLVRLVEFDPNRRLVGVDHPPEAETMIGMKRLDNLQHCVTDVLEQRVAGDLIETGVWRGGAVIFMRAILQAYRDRSRTVWAADSFAGLPKPDEERYPADRVHTQLRDSPAGRSTEHRPSPNAGVVGLPRVGGLHHRYTWSEAA